MQYTPRQTPYAAWPLTLSTIATFVKSIPGPMILVGHSYGGAVISVAAPSDPNVKALVYVDAFAPDEGESPLSLLAPCPPPPKDFFTAVPIRRPEMPTLHPEVLWVAFASDVPAARASIIAVTQRPLTNGALNEKAPAAEGWKTILILVCHRRRKQGDFAGPANDGAARKSAYHARELFASNDPAPGSDGSRNSRRSDPNICRREVVRWLPRRSNPASVAIGHRRTDCYLRI